jgi:hypothetical protein
VVTRATKSVMDFFAAPSFQDGTGSGPPCASAVVARSDPASAGSVARVATRARRLTSFEETIDFISGSSQR